MEMGAHRVVSAAHEHQQHRLINMWTKLTQLTEVWKPILYHILYTGLSYWAVLSILMLIGKLLKGMATKE